MSEAITCCDCGLFTWANKGRTERCKACHDAHIDREGRRRRFHEIVKQDPVKLEAHRKQSREAGKRYRARLKAKKGKGDAQGLWEVCL